jgi:tripartite-type tricarboxylate transporter receptor subunit TctC
MRSNPDGYTLLFASLGHSVNPILMPDDANYDQVADFAPVALVATQPLIAVTSVSSGFRSLNDLIEHARARPGSVTYGSAGNGGSAHLAAALLGVMAKVEMVHVPFRGNAPALAEVLAGRVSFMFYPSVGIAEHVAAKRLKVLAVGPSAGLPKFPHVPTMAQCGYPGFDDAAPWVGLIAPAKTPASIVERLNAELRQAVAKPEVKTRLEELGNVVAVGSPADFAWYLEQTSRTMKRIIESAGIKAQ